jgi:tRNA nucleotidyltransferase (CCA-adding enzyme)
MQDTLTNIPAERWLEEFKKLADSPVPSIGLNVAWELGIFQKHFPMFAEFKTTQEHQIHHTEGDTWTHTLMVVDEVARYNTCVAGPKIDTFLLFLAALCHDLGKPIVNVQDENGLWGQPGHSQAGLKPTNEFLTLLNVDNLTKEKVLKLVNDHLSPAILAASLKDRPLRALRRLATRLYPATIDELFPLAVCDILGRGTTEADKTEKKENLFQLWTIADVAQISDKKPEPIVTGKELLVLGFKPGPELGKLIVLLNNLHEDHDITKQQLLEAFVKNEQ